MARRAASRETYAYWLVAYEEVLKGMYATLLYNLRLRNVATRPIAFEHFCEFVYAHSSGRISDLHRGAPA